MKSRSWVLVLGLVLGLCLGLVGCGSGSEKGDGPVGEGSGGGAVKSVDDAADYLVGRKQLQIQVESTRRAGAANDKHNEELNKALEE